MRTTLWFLSLWLVGCGPKAPATDDTSDTIADDTDDTLVADTDDTDDTIVDDTDLGDTDAADTDLLDTDTPDTDVTDTDLPDTDLADTDVLDTDTGLVDTDVADTDVADTDVVVLDADSDGTADALDCAPNDAAVHPGAAEVCDGVDNNCSGDVDEGLSTFTAYLDDDGDGYGDAAVSVVVCQLPASYVLDDTDCDDATPSRHPGAAEQCGQELDCDASTVASCLTTFADVHPIFRQHCTTCHSTGGSGGHNVAASNINTAYAASQQSSNSVPGHTVGYATLVRIQSGSMPFGAGCTGNPTTDAGHAACLTASEQALIQAWLDDGQLR